MHLLSTQSTLLLSDHSKPWCWIINKLMLTSSIIGLYCEECIYTIHSQPSYCGTIQCHPLLFWFQYTHGIKPIFAYILSTHSTLLDQSGSSTNLLGTGWLADFQLAAFWLAETLSISVNIYDVMLFTALPSRRIHNLNPTDVVSAAFVHSILYFIIRGWTNNVLAWVRSWRGNSPGEQSPCGREMMGELKTTFVLFLCTCIWCQLWTNRKHNWGTRF